MDVRHEVALGYSITDTKAGDGETLPAVLGQTLANLPAGRVKTLAYDKAADGEDVHKALHAKKIKPVIQNRALWKEDLERPLPGREGEAANLVHGECGSVFCYDTKSEPCVRHPMAYIGHEPRRGTRKYRCPGRIKAASRLPRYGPYPAHYLIMKHPGSRRAQVGRGNRVAHRVRCNQ